MNYSVYVHVFPNGKLYIGATRQEPKKRWRSGGGYRNQKAMYEAILKYGWDNIKHIVLVSNLKEDMAMEIEKALIEKYSTQDTLYGYNTKDGGQHFGEHSEQFLSNLKERMSGNTYCAGRKLSESHIEALRQSNLGKHRPSKHKGDKIHTKETKELFSKNMKERWKNPESRKIYMNAVKQRNMCGKNNPMFGKHHSEETKRKISQKAVGRKLSAERIKRMSDAALKRSVIQMDLNGTELNKFNSVKEAAESVGAFSQNIGSVCSGKQKSCKGFLWRYEDDNSGRYQTADKET